MNRKSTFTQILAAGALCLSMGAGTAYAQAPGAQPPGQGQAPAQGQPPAAGPPPAASADVDEMTLSRFVDAYEDVRSIQHDLMDDIGEAGSREEANELQQSARQEMLSAIEGHDLSVDEFNQIVRGMQHDRKLNDRVQSALSVQ